MTPSHRDRLLQAQRKVHDAEKRLEPLYQTLLAAMQSNLASSLMNTLDGMIASHLSGLMHKTDIDVYAEFIAITLNVPKEAAQALVDYRIATCAILLTLRDVDRPDFKGAVNE